MLVTTLRLNVRPLRACWLKHHICLVCMVGAGGLGKYLLLSSGMVILLSAELLEISLGNQPLNVTLSDVELTILGQIDRPGSIR